MQKAYLNFVDDAVPNSLDFLGIKIVSDKKERAKVLADIQSRFPYPAADCATARAYVAELEAALVDVQQKIAADPGGSVNKRYEAAYVQVLPNLQRQAEECDMSELAAAAEARKKAEEAAKLKAAQDAAQSKQSGSSTGQGPAKADNTLKYVLIGTGIVLVSAGIFYFIKKRQA